jgi:SWI/SNF-related matrix-associated actin-dependent regulator 1 of chromatin subfamily A
MMTPLYPYQASAVGRIAAADKPMLNAFDPGLGKSRVALSVLYAKGFRRVLIFCPSSVLLVWEAEVRKWWGMPTTIVRSGSPIPAKEGIFIVSYGLISEASGATTKLFEKTTPFDACVIDEVHYLKNPRANRSKRIFDLLKAGKLGWVHPMSGTPAPNNAGEIWGLLYHLRPDCIVSPVNGKPMREGEFVARYCTVDQFKVNGGRHWVTRITGSKNKDELRERIAPMVLRARKKDVLPDLPPLDFVVLPVAAVGAPTLGGFDGLDDDAVLAEVAKAKSEIQNLGLAKIPAVVECVADLLDSDPRRRLVVWAMHHRVIDRYVELLAQYSPVKLDGRDDLAARRAAIEQFMSRKASIFVGQIQAGGTGLTLVSPTAPCSDVIFAESSFSWTDNVQAACRIHRIGQMDGVLARYASAVGTLDDRIQEILARKSRDWVEVFG